jgi:Lon protease-like protein
VAPVPLFPLPMVLFPGTVELLHIFEPRYRRMLTDIMSGDRAFGLLCCPAGTQEATIPPGTVGTMARVETVQRLEDGRSNIAIRGMDRFVFRGYVSSETPYRAGTVEPLAEPVSSPMAAARDQLERLFDRAARAARQLVDDHTPVPDLPGEHPARAYAMAQLLDLPLGARLELLTIPDAEGRTQRLVSLLTATVPLLEERAARHRAASSNGHGPHG